MQSLCAWPCRRGPRTLTPSLLPWSFYPAAVGVEHEEVPDQPETAGVVGRALQSLEGLMRDTYYSTSILVALFLMRECCWV